MAQRPEPSGWTAIAFTSDGTISSLVHSGEIDAGSPDEPSLRIADVLEDSTLFQLSEIMDQASDAGMWQGEVRYRSGNGHPRSGFGTLVPVNLGEQSTRRFLLITTFGSREPLNESVQHEIGSRLRIFCHELNNPLAVVLGLAQLTIQNPECTEKIRNDMEKLYSELKRAVEVVHRLHQYGFDLQDDRTEPEKGAHGATGT
jgi:hypothetical protein